MIKKPDPLLHINARLTTEQVEYLQQMAKQYEATFAEALRYMLSIGMERHKSEDGGVKTHDS